MEAIRFNVEGIFNSFRVPFFRTYHKSFLAPPKTTVIGLLTNVMRKSEEWYYNALEFNYFNVSIVINNINGKCKDLWSYKTMEDKSDMHGRSIIRRDKLYMPNYTVYISINNDILKEKNIDYQDLENEILFSLKQPCSIPSLGLDDEIVRIYDVAKVKLTNNNEATINSVFMDKNYKFTARINDKNKQAEFPTSNIVPLSYTADFKKDKRESRKAKNESKQVEYINCDIIIIVGSGLCRQGRAFCDRRRLAGRLTPGG